ncbi:MAG: lactate utilization protein C [Planctomycetales bacterium]
MDRDLFLERVRKQAIAGRAFPVPVNPEATSEQSYVGGGADPVGTFLAEWQGAGGQGARCRSLAEVNSYIRSLIERMGAKSVLCWKHPLLEKLKIDSTIREYGAEPLLWDKLEGESEEERWLQTFAADLGITSVDWGIAETGSLVVCSRAGGRGRAVSLLPPVHLALLEPSQILPDLFDLYERLGEDLAGLPSNVALITGPSKTGDIQLQLTTGVHGPGEVHAVVCEFGL